MGEVMIDEDFKGFRIVVKSSAYADDAWYARVSLHVDLPEHGLYADNADTWDTPPCAYMGLARRYGEAMTRGIRLNGYRGGMFRIRDGEVLT